MSMKPYDHIGNALGASPHAGPQASATRSGPIDTVQSSLTAADVLADEVQSFVNDLIGAVPEPIMGDTGEYPDGRLHSLASRARSINANVTRACEALQRLRNFL